MVNDQDRRLLLAMLGVLLAQTVTGLVWAGGAAARLDYLEARMMQTNLLSERTARLEAQSTLILDALVRIETRLDTQRKEVR